MGNQFDNQLLAAVKLTQPETLTFAEFEDRVYDRLEDNKTIYLYHGETCFWAYPDEIQEKIYLNSSSDLTGVITKAVNKAEFGVFIKLLWGAGFVPYNDKRN